MHKLFSGVIILIALLVTVTNAHAPANLSLQSQFLAPHNVIRYARRLPPLVWDAKIARYAQWYASKRQFDCELVHSDGPYGENIFWGSGYDWTPGQAVAAWAEEKKWYNYMSNSCVNGEICGHYTQIVWRATRRVGCAKVGCAGGRGLFIVCNYDPPGNYIGEKPY